MAKAKPGQFARETDLCAAFLGLVTRHCRDWVAYPETSGWDILLVRKSDGLQIGVEAKLALNPEVVAQALESSRWDFASPGPDHRAVLVPSYATGRMTRICDALGITVIRQPIVEGAEHYARFYPHLPSAAFGEGRDWFPWCPGQRHKLPEYVPDVVAGDSGPLKLTGWKIKALRLAVLLEERPVTRADFKALNLDPRRFTDKHTGWLVPTPDGYVAGPHTPDFKGMHPRVWQEVKADRAKWDTGAVSP